MSEQNAIRTLGFYQPFGTLMLHGKIETRWVRKGKKPPFPLGKYLLYTTLKKCENYQLFDWCGIEIMESIFSATDTDETKHLNGFALCYGTLTGIRPMTLEDETKAFVKFKGTETRQDKNGVEHEYVQYCLMFENIERIEPFPFAGKQGVGFFKREYPDWLHELTLLGYEKGLTISSDVAQTVEGLYKAGYWPKDAIEMLVAKEN